MRFAIHARASDRHANELNKRERRLAFVLCRHHSGVNEIIQHTLLTSFVFALSQSIEQYGRGARGQMKNRFIFSRESQRRRRNLIFFKKRKNKNSNQLEQHIMRKSKMSFGIGWNWISICTKLCINYAENDDDDCMDIVWSWSLQQ